jgi:N-carbamoylputrescine amidase
MKDIRVASVQFHHTPGDKQANMAKIGMFVERAAAQKVELIAFPEMCLTGYVHVRDLGRSEIEELAEPIPRGPATEQLMLLSKKYQMTIGVGLIEKAEDGALYNSYVVTMPDGTWACHRKLHCFISEHMSSGDSYTVFSLPQGIKVGVLICYDNNHVENARITALMEAEILLAPHQTGGVKSPSPRCMGLIDPELWENRLQNPERILDEFQGPKGRGWIMRWLPARAHDNGFFLIFSNGVGVDSGEVRTGNAMVLDPYGEILVESRSVDDDMVVADLDASILETSSGRRWLRSRRPELYGPLVLPTGKEEPIRKVRQME